MPFLTESWMWWALALAIGLPILLVVLTEIIGILIRRGHPAAKPLKLLRNWVLPVGALFALLAFAFRSEQTNAWPRLIATILGFLVILLLLSALNVALFASAKTGTWRDRIPTIFVEIARLALVVVGLAVLFSWVWDADVGGLIAALGVTSIVIGLALQNAVGGVISGLLVLFEQPFKIGDWLDIGDVRGRAVEVNWRATHIDTGSGIQVVPNSTLAGASFTNMSRPAGPFHTSTTLQYTTDDPPHEVIALLIEVAESLPMRAEGEHASAEYAGNGTYSVTLKVQGPAVEKQAMSVYLAWLWYASRRRGLALDGDSTDPIAEPAQLTRAVQIVAPTLNLNAEERDRVIAASHLERFGTGETVQRAGEVPDQMRFVVDGQLRLAVEAGGGQIPFGAAERGDYVGQTSLTRAPTQTVAVSGSVTTLLVVPVATIDALVAARPALARQIGDSIETRRGLAAEALASAGVVRGTLGGG